VAYRPGSSSPAPTLLSTADLEDRIVRGEMRHVITDPAGTEKLAEIPGSYTRVVVGGTVPGWRSYAELPKTISGKIRRVDLRAAEERRRLSDRDDGPPGEFREEQFPWAEA
jgi:acyl-coenzyme A synthetase/AMP-(fatty) acid ligase